MFDKATRRYFTLIFAIYLTALLGLSVVTATKQESLGSQVAEGPEGSPSSSPHTTPKRDTIVSENITPSTIRDQARIWFYKRGYPLEWKCIDQVIWRESRWIPNQWNSQGSTAYGLGQVKGSHSYTANKPMKQFKVAVRYAIHKHGTLCKALKHHDTHGWY